MLIAVIDSGYSGEMSERIIGGVSICKEGNIIIGDDFTDVSGHGTAVTDLIIKQSSDEVKIFVIRILDQKEACSPDVLKAAFLYILENVQCDLIHISAGIEGCCKHNELRNTIRQLYERNIYVVAAFANNGSVSYPAAFHEVFGVDLSDKAIKKDQFEYVEGGIVNFRTSPNYYRVNWNGKNMILNGSSFSSTLITAKIAALIKADREMSFCEILEKMKENACYVYDCRRFPKLRCAKELSKEIGKTIVFPFNKEIHQIAANEELCDFDVAGYYTFKYDMNMGKKVNQVLPYCTNEKRILNIDSIDWESDFDTVILGHCGEIEETTREDYTGYIFEQALTNHKKIYSLGSVVNQIRSKKECKELVAFPYVDISDVPQNRFGKLRKTGMPVIMVCGTSSKQGKFHVQLELRKRFLQDGYIIFQVSTEPTGYLFGMDYVYPMGYDSTCYITGQDAVLTLNEQFEQADEKNADLILVGSQSGTIPYRYDNLSKLTLQQTELLMALNPDAVVLCINYNDDLDYIERTINYIESINCCKVVCMCMLPKKYRHSFRSIQKIDLTLEEIQVEKEKIDKRFGIQLFLLGDTKEMDGMYQKIIDFF